MLKALRRFTQLLRVHIYVPGCCKYIRMTNGLQPLVELCMDGCFADKTAVRDFSPNGCFFHAANAAQRCMGEKLAFAAGASSSSPSPQRTSSKLPKNFDPTGWFSYRAISYLH